ncbi:MAG: alcohol dehydrogenase catalytic domain-containing protein [Ktedonobacteraceae bacterium]
MRALVFRAGNFALDHNYPKPVPQEGEALVRVLLTGICNTDLEIVRGYMGFEGVLGHEFVGIVESICGTVAQEQYAPLLGKRVVGDINAACYQPDCDYCQRGMSTHCPRRTTLGIAGRDGAFADCLLLPVENLRLVPENVSDEQAVFVEPLAANFEILEQAHLKPTDSVLILGDGKMGQLAARVLPLSGCEVLMLGKHQEKLALAEKCGVQPVLLGSSEHIALEQARRITTVVECSGSAQGLETALRLVRPRGTIILKSTTAAMSTINLAPIVIDEIRVQGSRCGPFVPALRALSQERLEVHSLISACYTLDEAVAAFKYAEQKGVLKTLVRV